MAFTTSNARITLFQLGKPAGTVVTAARMSRLNSIPDDVREFLQDYPGVGDSEETDAQQNLRFYSNAVKCRPDGLLIEELLSKSYELMLDFYGMRLLDAETGLLGRKEDGWETRYQNLTRKYRCITQQPSHHSHPQVFIDTFIPSLCGTFCLARIV
ncbi:hypothetical protein FRC06_003910 [Ceratobasidium sp. 370]|nr:hypothetical protein FRC06_003910 [Ceratobasidium sp. 370]